MGQLPSVLPREILSSRARNTMRAPLNPLDKCTIVSIYPREIKERKATIQPGFFEIAAGSIDKPAFLVVGSSSWWKNVDVDDTPQPLLEIPVSSPQIAEAVVKDYCNGLIAFAPDAMPGLFFILGDMTVKNAKGEMDYDATVKALKSKFSQELGKADTKQTNWYNELLNLADGLWANSDGNPMVISSDMKLAAEQLGVSTKPWMANTIISQTIRCKACGAPRNPEFPVCPSCHAVDKDVAEKLGIVFAK